MLTFALFSAVEAKPSILYFMLHGCFYYVSAAVWVCSPLYLLCVLAAGET